MADKDPTIPFYAQDFYMDTIQLPEHLVGAYIRILCTLWVNKFCYYDAITLAMISPSAKEVVDKLKDKFVFNKDNTFTSKRLEEVREKRRLLKENRVNAGSLGAKNRWQKDSKQDSKKIANVTVNENEIENKSIPGLNEFLSYCKTLSIYHSSFDFQIEAKYNAWKENKWKDGNNKPIKNWKTKIQNTMPYFKKDLSNGRTANQQRRKDYVTKDEYESELKSLYEGGSKT